MPRRIILRILGLGLIVLALGLGRPQWAQYRAVDECLDAGGSFDYTAKTCDYERAHPYMPYSPQAWSLVAALACGALGLILVLRSCAGRFRS